MDDGGGVVQDVHFDIFKLVVRAPVAPTTVPSAEIDASMPK